MKNNLKLIVLICMLFLASGCTIKYDIYIDKDQQVTDTLNLNFPTELARTYYDNPRDYVEYMYEVKTEEYGVEGYTKDYEVNDDFIDLRVTKNHSSFENYFNSGIIKRLYNNPSIQRDGDDLVVSLTGMTDIFNMFSSYDLNYEVEPFKIAIRSFYSIVDDNADERNKLTGEYIWNFKPGDMGKTISFRLTDNLNHTAVAYDKFGKFIIPVVVLAILVIAYIIYSMVKNKFDGVNKI